MRPKPKNASEHHGAFGRMRLRFEGVLETGRGARLHRFEFGCQGYRWQRTAADKIARHLGAAGYDVVSSVDTPDNCAVSLSDRAVIAAFLAANCA